MTGLHTLSSTGAPPPEISRPYLPDRLRPKAARAEETPAPERRTASPDASRNADTNASKPKADRTAFIAVAVAVQVEESKATQPPEPKRTFSASGLSDEDKAHVARLKDRDREVRAHEAAHASAGAGFAGRPAFEYVRGPDGIQYAVGGHVSIDVKVVAGDPVATAAKMEAVERAALAPARPSGQDRAVALSAAAKRREAEAELLAAKRAEVTGEAAPQRALPVNLLA